MGPFHKTVVKTCNTDVVEKDTFWKGQPVVVEQSPPVKRENADVARVPQFKMPSNEKEEEEPEKQQKEEAKL